MIDRLPEEIFDSIVSQLAQEDKVALTYVSKKVYHLTVPSLYQNLYLNERYYFPSDFDNSLGTHTWSVLYFQYIGGDNNKDSVNSKVGTHKFQCLIRSIKDSSERLGPLIKRVHCSWHIDQKSLIIFLELLNKYSSNLILFESFIKGEIGPYLWKHSSNLESLNITPPETLPNKEAADAKYFELMRYTMSKYNIDRIQNLTIHVNALSFFKKNSTPLKIRSLCLNLRDDTYDAEPLDPSIHYYDIFDASTLKELEILSWYNEDAADLDLYELWNLRDFYEFKNINSLSFLSLFANEDYIKGCIENFNFLKRLKIDFMYDTTISKATIDLMGRSPCAKTLEYIDMKVEDLDVPLLSIENDEISNFVIDMTCKCDDCKKTYIDVIQRKYFSTKESYVIKDFHDVEQKNFVLQMFKLFTMIPYSSGFDSYPSIGFYAKPLDIFVQKVNSIQHPGYENASDDHLNKDILLTVEDVIRLYHLFIHSMKKSFDYFIVRFKSLQYLVLNDLPTKIIQYDAFQKCNIPIFHYHNYKSNQVYELVDNESLFD